jgi:hypothetical protein
MAKKEKPSVALAGTAELFPRWYRKKFDDFGDILLNVDTVHLVDINFSDLDNCISRNEKLLKSVSMRNIVYCIWQTKLDGDFETVYIGHANAKQARARVRSHLFKKTGTTACKIEEVKKAITDDKNIGFSFIEVQPGFFRSSIEEYLIIKYSEQLPWNTAMKDKLKKSIK